MRRALAVVCALAAAPPAPAWAQDDEEEEEDSDEEGGDEEEEDEEEAAAGEPSGTGKDAASEEEEEDLPDDGLRPKQNLTGHDLGTKKRENEFEKDRFFVDKIDTEKTEEGTLVQGSIASSSFLYAERGGEYATVAGSNNTGPSRLFTELRLQTDFRHIKASRWEARLDARVRAVTNISPAAQGTMTPENNPQSGLTGDNEYELRELWLIRAGKRTDFIMGRQFVPDLGGVKFDGIRFDYAKSAKLTLLGFAGLYPLRGSRSLTTDYQPLKSPTGAEAGRIVTVGGFGGAYRTVNSYGAIGAVAMYPLKIETPRFYVTSQGYMRSGSKLDVYHFALLDLLGAAANDSAAHIQATNLSAGVNLKPSPRLRLTASAHQVDTETLNVQAGQFLNGENPLGNTVVQNEAYVLRLATRSARAAVSAGLGKLQRFEVTAAVSVRNRPEFTLKTVDAMTADVKLPAANSVEVFGSFVDRRSLKDIRVGIDGSQSFGVGTLAFQRSEALFVRLHALRAFANGRGEWEAEINYTKVKDSIIGQSLSAGVPGCGDPAQPSGTQVPSCYGTSNNQLYSAGGQLTYRLRRDWLGLGTLHVLRVTNKRSDQINDPAVLGVTGYIRIAKRF